jgi:hypothetical protein
LAGVACLALIAGATVMTLPHLILGIVVLAFANQLDPGPSAHRMLKALGLILVIATLLDGFLIATDVYDLKGSPNPFRPRWISYTLLWFLLYGNQSSQAKD